MDEKYFNINEDGLSVRCKLYHPAGERTFSHVALATYGFGGNKDNHAIQKFAEKLIAKYKGYAVLTFDWPAHGTDGRKRVSAPESLAYMQLAAAYATRELAAEHLFLYSTSYGGYIALRYLAEIGDPFERVALRCPCIDMYTVFCGSLTADERAKLARGKKVLKGWDRKSEIDQAFLDDIKEHDVRRYEYFDYADTLLLLHGEADEVVPIADTRDFADANVIEVISVPKADHPFSNPQLMDYAIGEVVKFFAPEAAGE